MIEVSSASDIGRVRTSNEDSYGVFSPAVYVVADGLGGHAAGEVASRMVVAAVHDMANEGQMIDTAALKSAVLRANQQVLDASAGNSSYEGMGSTATVLHVDEDTGIAYYAHVGDSRLYLLRRGVFRQVSRDHSYVEELVARGELSEAEAQHIRARIFSCALLASRNVSMWTAIPSRSRWATVCSSRRTG